MMQRLMSAMVFLLLFSGCAKKDKSHRPKAQEIRFNLHTDPPTLDPRRAIDATSLSVINMCFEGLMRIDPLSKNPVFAIAKSKEVSEDGLHYTFTLREAKWSDGHPLTAYDFEKTWKEMLDPSFPCEFATDLYILKNGRAAKLKKCSLDEIGVKALDDQTLQVELDHPAPYFLHALATHIFYPTAHHVTSQNSEWVNENYVANGPFSLKQWRHHDFLKLVKNPHYWDAENVKIERVMLALVDDESTELTMFENGELDWAGFPNSMLPAEALFSLKKKGILEQYSIAGTYYYLFNTKEFPFTNANVRKAFSLAIDRQAIVANVTQMGQAPAMALVPPSLWKNPKAYFRDHDIEEAKRLFAQGLRELGITLEELPAITLSYNTVIGHHKVAQAIQQQWSQVLGVNVHLENKEWKVFLDEIRHNKFQVARMGGLASYHDAISFLDYYRYLSSANNFCQWDNPQYSELLDLADHTVDPDKREAYLQAAEKILMEEMPVAPIYYYMGAYIKKPYVKGIHISDLNDFDLKWAYLELDDQISR